MTFDRIAFLEHYLTLIRKAWSKPDYLTLVLENPRQALAEHSLQIPADAQIEIVLMQDARDGRVEDQVDDWEEGLKTGYFRLMLVVPPGYHDRESS